MTVPSDGQQLRQRTIEEGYKLKRSLVSTAGDALGPTADAHLLTATEEEYAWDLPNGEEFANRDHVWIQELQAAKERFPDLTYSELVEEARPHVGARLYKFRTSVIGSGGRIDVREQADYANRVLRRVQKNRGEEPGPPKELLVTPAAAPEPAVGSTGLALPPMASQSPPEPAPAPSAPEPQPVAAGGY